ncbi:MAG: hypothetical protein NZ895_00395 [Archaeoglobaceae archaeon]|nr:hypothetical protein [Archaeoglobaceae archaeon]MCX8151879.1 hypothetical protein [Archaeoglobaceae archaeon]MDW8013268.1 hypothetical protein [Archaeoglobaceae archaeon]
MQIYTENRTVLWIFRTLNATTGEEINSSHIDNWVEFFPPDNESLGLAEKGEGLIKQNKAFKYHRLYECDEQCNHLLR